MIPRASVGQPIPLSVTWYAPNTETPTDPDGNVSNVSVTHVNGTVVLASTAQTRVGAGLYSYTLPAQTLPAILNVTFTANFTALGQTYTDQVEVTQSQMCELADIRSLDALNDTTIFTTAKLQRARDAAAVMFESQTGRRWVRSYAREVLDGDPSLRLANMASNLGYYAYNPTRRIMLSNQQPRTLLSVTSTSYGAAPVTELDLSIFNLYSSGEVEKSLTAQPFARGIDNVIIEYLYGFDAPPLDLRNEFLRYIRYLLLQGKSRIPDNATSMQSESMSVTLGTATPDKPTGIPSVDEVLYRYGYRQPVIA